MQSSKDNVLYNCSCGHLGVIGCPVEMFVAKCEVKFCGKRDFERAGVNLGGRYRRGFCG